jgi:phospholipid/cholesterol/gamma-HCH transport system substrate-binding protein
VHTLSMEMRVGIFTLVVLAFLSFGLFWLNGGRFMERGYPVEIKFARVDGLRPGAPVKLSGVDVGRVKKIFFTPDQNVMVVIWLRPEFRVTEGSQAVITTAGVIGEKHLEIRPGKSQKPLPSGQRLVGVDPIATEDFYRIVSDILVDLKDMTNSFKTLVDDEETMASLRNSIKQINTITANLQTFTEQLNNVPLESMVAKLDRTLTNIESITSSAEPGIKAIVSEVTTASEQLTTVLVKANRFMDELNGDSQATEDIRHILELTESTMANIESLTYTLAQEKDRVGPLMDEAENAIGSISSAANSIEQMVNDLSSSEEGGKPTSLKKTLQETSELVRKANGYVTALERMRHRVGYTINEENDWQLNYRLDMGLSDRSSLVFDWHDIGDNNSLSLQYGLSFKGLRARLGYIHKDFGGGLDWQPSARWVYSLDFRNPNNWETDLTGSYLFNEHWQLGITGFNLFDDPTLALQLGYWF